MCGCKFISSIVCSALIVVSGLVWIVCEELSRLFYWLVVVSLWAKASPQARIKEFLLELVDLFAKDS